jgi:hypothetical protein
VAKKGMELLKNPGVQVLVLTDTVAVAKGLLPAAAAFLDLVKSAMEHTRPPKHINLPMTCSYSRRQTPSAKFFGHVVRWGLWGSG